MHRALLFYLAVLAFVPPAFGHAADTPLRPNIVFILADDLGWTDLGCQGSKYYETPHIDRLARGGVRFTDGYTCGPNCQPTRAALMTGQYGPRTGVYTVGSTARFDTSRRPLVPVENSNLLPLDRPILANALKEAGYATGMFGKWHLGQRPRYHPSQRGFDKAIVSMGRHFDFETQPRTAYPKGAYLADWLTDNAERFLDENKDRPFFLYLPHFGVHSPHQAKKDLIARFKGKPPVGGHKDPTYAAMIASVDESVGRIVRKLEALNLTKNTLVIFSSDNGGVGGYREAGVAAKEGITSNAPLRGGKGMLYEGGIRVPWIASWPGTIAPGRTCGEPITSVDLFPTLAELAGAKLDKGPKRDGVSLVPLLKGGEGTSLSRKGLYWHFPGYLGSGKDVWRTTPAGAVRAGDWKLVEFFETGKIEIYNLRVDLGEKTDLAKAKPAKRDELHAQLRDWRASISAPMPRKRK